MDKLHNSDGSTYIEDDTTYMAALRKWLTWGHVKKKILLETYSAETILF